MTDFKVGDVVTFVMPDFAPWQGGKGTILKHELDGTKDNFYVEVTEVPPANGSIRVGHTAWLWPEWLELVKPEPKFKIGDWVKVQGRNDKWDGTVGTVQKVKPPLAFHGILYTIHKDDTAVGDNHVLSFFEFQLVTTEAPAKFKVGDSVLVTKDKSLSQYGKSCTVTSLNGPYKDWPIEVQFPQGFRYNYAVDELELLLTIKNFSVPKFNFASGGFVLPKPAADMVNGPSHYGGADNPYEAIKVAEAWGFEKNAYLFNALKYLARAEHKGRKVEDLKKLQFYVAREIALEEAK